MFNIMHKINWCNGKTYWIHSAKYVNGKEEYRLLERRGVHHIVSDWFTRAFIDFHTSEEAGGEG
jgi:hypothetical protein